MFETADGVGCQLPERDLNKEGEASQSELGTSLHERSLYRVVSEGEFEQIRRDDQFALAGGAEGKYFWETLDDANAWSARFNSVRIVEATYDSVVAELFYSWSELDGLGAARFADEAQMNHPSLRIRLLTQNEKTPK